MPREKADFRDNLERLNALFPDKEVLTTQDCMRVLGCKSPKTARKHLPLAKGRITKVALARALS